MEQGIYEFSALLRLASPALIGSGVGDRTDMDVLRDAEGRPYIPASTMAGVLRHMTAEDFSGALHREIWGELGGNVETQADSRRSAVTIYDLLPKDAVKTGIRDGIRLDPTTGLVADKAKFDHEIIERGATFRFRLQVRHDAGLPAAEAERFVSVVHGLLRDGRVHVGARTTSGLGRLEYADGKQPEVSRWATGTSPRERLDWLDRKPRPLAGAERERLLGLAGDHGRRATARIVAEFKLRGSLLVRSCPGAPEKPDAVQLRSGEAPVIPGSSLKGAIRARAGRIARLLAGDKDPKRADNYLDRLFGTIGSGKAGEARRGRVRIAETVLPAFPERLQTRIKTDRFTGGTIEGALFDSMPLFADTTGAKLKIEMEIEKAQAGEIGLLLLVLKDLWSGNLALGGEKNVGRGSLEGVNATISLPDGTAVALDTNTLAAGLGTLQPQVDALVKALEEGPHEGGQ